jgi:serine/threonine protein phosphatase PrpC
MTESLRSAARSDVGLVRSGNEDSGYAGSYLLAVADGMGGHAAGEIASAVTIATLSALDVPGLSTADVLPALAAGVDDASARISEISQGGSTMAGLGTTAVAIYWTPGRISIVHVGDSRAYLLRGGELTQLTHDHTYVQGLVDAGRISPAEASRHPRRNIITRAIDGSLPVESDLSIREARAGDRFLLCTDGLSGVVADDEIAEVLGQGDPTGTVTLLVDLALERGAPDNVTVVVGHIVDADVVPVSPVVVGAAGEPRVRDRLPSLVFPNDSQIDPDGQPALPGEASTTMATAATGRSTGRRWMRVVLPVIAVLFVAGLAIAGAVGWVRSQWYVGINSGYVAIYQGIPGSLAGLPLQQVAETTDLPVTSLPAIRAESLAEGIDATSLSAAEQIVTTLRTEAANCTPSTTGPCP